MKIEKTNALRILEQNNIIHKAYEYEHNQDEFKDGATVASLIGEDPNRVFKTIVLVDSNKYFVCLVPVLEEIDLKKAAKAFKVKSLELLHVKDLFKLTGYIRGGCSPIGMKKSFKTVVDETALLYDEIIFSGGRIGLQIEMNPLDLEKLIDVSFNDILR